MTRILPLLLIITACIINTSLGCSCSPETPLSKYCRADYAILARVINERTSGDWRIYSIRIIWKIKSNKSWSTVRQYSLYTQKTGAMCGVELTHGKIYFITGSFRPGSRRIRMKTNLCDLQITNRRSTVRRIRRIRRRFTRRSC